MRCNKNVIMESAFIYNKYVTGKNFVGRRTETGILGNLLEQGENVAIYEPPKTGKHSLIEQTFFNMKIATRKFSCARCTLLNTRTIADVMLRLGSATLKAFFNNGEDLSRAVSDYLQGTHFVFDPQVFSASGAALSLGWDIDGQDIRAVFELPYRLASDKSQKTFVMLDEFQNIMLTEDGEGVCKILDDVFRAASPEQRQWCSYLLVGSRLNAMKDIFEVRKLFYRHVEHLPIAPMESREIIDHTVRGFLSSGKVMDRDLMMGACKLFRNNIWYVSHFSAICDSLSKGYMTESVLVEALDTLISIHEPRFQAIVSDLTTFQVCLLRAIIDGYTKFSSTEVIKKYNLSSSANVRRLKDALIKKEVVTFNEQEEPQIIDPLFEYWLRKHFFEIVLD